jgi:6-phosphogluconolactonase
VTCAHDRRAQKAIAIRPRSTTIGSVSALVLCACSENGTIARYAFDQARGKLELLGTTAVPGATQPGKSLPLAQSPDGRFVYAAVRVPPFPIVTFAVMPTGELDPIAAANSADSLAYLTVDATGRHLLAVSFPASLVVRHAIDADGRVTTPPRQVIEGVDKAHSIVVDAANRHAYVAARDEDRVRHYHFDAATGVLTPANPPWLAMHAGAGPRHVAFDPTESRLYCVNETDGTVTVMSRDLRTGALARIQSLSMLPYDLPRVPNVRAADIAVDPAGRFVYATERSSSTLASFAVETGGTLTLVSSEVTEASARGMRMTGDGRWLLVAGELSGHVSLYALEIGVPVRRDRCNAGPGANWILCLDKP